MADLKMVVHMDAVATPGAISVASIRSVCPGHLTYYRNMLVYIRANYAGSIDEFWCGILRHFGLLLTSKPAASRGRRKQKRLVR